MKNQQQQRWENKKLAVEMYCKKGRGEYSPVLMVGATACCGG
jgi:hypothetical protein